MSIVREAIWAAAPSTDIFHPTPLSADSKGERIAYASGKSIFLRSIDHPETSREYTGHTAQTTVAKFAPSGFYVASGDVSGAVKVWDTVGEGVTKGDYRIINGRINDVAWDGDSQRIIAVGDGKERFGHCVTADSGNSVGEISGHNKEINSVSIRQQRPLRAATASADKTVGFFHGAPFKYNTSMRSQHPTGEVSATAFSPDGSLLISVGRDKVIWLYDGKTGESLRQISKGDHTGSILGISWAPDSKRFVTSAADRTVRLWDVESGKIVHTWTMTGRGPAGQQCGVVWPSGRKDGLVISLDGAGNLNYLYPDTESATKAIQGHQKGITSSLLVPSSAPAFITGSSDGTIRIWDTAQGVASEPDGQSHSISVISLAVSSKSSTVWSAGLDNKLRSIDINTKTFLGTTIDLKDMPKGLGITPSSDIVVATTSELAVYESSGSEKSSVPISGFTPTCIATSKDIIVLGGSNKTLNIYDASLKLKNSLSEGLKAEPSTLSFSDQYLAVGTALGGISVYSISDWTLVTSRWSAHTARVTSISWSPDSSHAVSGSLDTNVFVWSMENPGKRVKAANAHKDGVSGVAWLSGNGKSQALSAGGDGCVKVWNISTS